MTTTIAKFALIAALFAWVVLGLTAYTDEVDFNAGVAAYKRGDYATAIREWRRLAEQDHAEAQFNLGLMYFNGQSVTQDFAKAHMWFILAASRLPPGKNRDNAVKDRDTVAEMMTPAQISEAQKLAREWRPLKGGRIIRSGADGGRSSTPVPFTPV